MGNSTAPLSSVIPHSGDSKSLPVYTPGHGLCHVNSVSGSALKTYAPGYCENSAGEKIAALFDVYTLSGTRCGVNAKERSSVTSDAVVVGDIYVTEASHHAFVKGQEGQGGQGGKSKGQRALNKCWVRGGGTNSSAVVGTEVKPGSLVLSPFNTWGMTIISYLGRDAAIAQMKENLSKDARFPPFEPPVSPSVPDITSRLSPEMWPQTEATQCRQ